MCMCEVERNRKVCVPEYTPGPAVGPGVELAPPRCQSSGYWRCSAHCHCSARSPMRRKRMKRRKRTMKRRSGAFPACLCSGLMAWETIPPPLKPHQASLRSGTQTRPVEKRTGRILKYHICRRTILSRDRSIYWYLSRYLSILPLSDIGFVISDSQINAAI